MPVSDDIVAAARAYLQGDKETFKRLDTALDDSHDANLAYKAMIIAAFLVAVQRKFNKASPRDEIIEYVADVRSRSDDLARVVDPVAAERLITAVFTNENIDDIDSRTSIGVEMFVATAIVNDEAIHGQALEDFLTDSRGMADRLLG